MASLLGLSGYGSDSSGDEKSGDKSPSQLGSVQINVPVKEGTPKAPRSLVSGYSDDVSSDNEMGAADKPTTSDINPDMPPPDAAKLKKVSSTPIHYPTPSPFREVKDDSGPSSAGQRQIDSMLDELGPNTENGDDAETFMDQDEETDDIYTLFPRLKQLPEEPTEECKPELQQRVTEYLTLAREKGYDLTDNLKKKKEFGNPQILQKVVDFFGIDDISSNYPKEIFDPHGYSQEHFCDNLVLAQRRAQAARQAAALPPAPNAAAAQQMTDRLAAGVGGERRAKRASKWGAAAPAAPGPAAAGGHHPQPPPPAGPPPGAAAGGLQQAALAQQQQQMLAAQQQAALAAQQQQHHHHHPQGQGSLAGLLGARPGAAAAAAATGVGQGSLAGLPPHLVAAVQQLQGGAAAAAAAGGAASAAAAAAQRQAAAMSAQLLAKSLNKK